MKNRRTNPVIFADTCGALIAQALSSTVNGLIPTIIKG